MRGRPTLVRRSRVSEGKSCRHSSGRCSLLCTCFRLPHELRVNKKGLQEDRGEELTDCLDRSKRWRSGNPGMSRLRSSKASFQRRRCRMVENSPSSGCACRNSKCHLIDRRRRLKAFCEQVLYLVVVFRDIEPGTLGRASETKSSVHAQTLQS